MTAEPRGGVPCTAYGAEASQSPLGEPLRRVEAEGRRLSLDPERIWVFRHGETRPW